MAKRKSRPAPVNVSVNTSTVVNSTDNTSEFRALIELQKLSNEHLQSMRDSLAQSLETASDSLLTQRIQALEELSIQRETQKQEKETQKKKVTIKKGKVAPKNKY